MILDSSAIVAILCREPGPLTLIDKMLASDVVAVGAPTVSETAMVLTIKMKRDGLAHRAALNFGDCLSYAAAKVSGQPLLFVGGDFAGTDVQAA
jgi:ribonuclease VapC